MEFYVHQFMYINLKWKTFTCTFKVVLNQAKHLARKFEKFYNIIAKFFKIVHKLNF